MYSIKPPAFTCTSLPPWLAIFLATGLLPACAPIPFLDRPAAFKSPSEYQTQHTFTAPQGAWPTTRWWEDYGDHQLNHLVEEALQGSPDMAAAAARVRRAESQIQGARSALGPQVNGNASVSGQKLSYNYLTPRYMTPDGWNDYERLSLDFSWELDFWGKNRAGLAAATSQKEATQAEFAEVRLLLSTAMAASYGELAQMYEIRDTITRSVEVRRQTLALFEKRYAHGLETKASLNEAKSRLAGSEDELLQMDEQIGLQRNRLAALVGAGPDRGLAIHRPILVLDQKFALPRTLAAELLGRRPDIVAARLQAESLAHIETQKRAQFYPNINLSAFIGLQSLGLDALGQYGSDIGGIGPAISLPIFNSGRLESELRGSRSSYNEAVANYNRTVTQALEEVANAGLSLKALSSQLAKTQEATEAAHTAYTVVRNRYQGGLATYLEVLYAEDAWIANQRNLAALRTRSFILDVALKRALGGGYQV